MVALASLHFVLIVSLIIVRIATVALTLPGLSRQSAKFQARSAWTGTGFTTAESEIDTRDYAGLMHLAGEYAIAELPRRRATGLSASLWQN